MNLILKIIRINLVFFLLLTLNLVFSQQDEFINGELFNSKNEVSIPFATIRIKNKAKGVISNSDGGFTIPTEFQTMGDTLIISSIGYQSKEILMSNLKRDKVNLITLTEKTEALDEITLLDFKKTKRRNAKEIVRLAIMKIPENYSFIPFSYVGYYRDYQIKEKDYLNLNEAILEVLDPGFGVNDLKGTRIILYEYKKNLNFPIDTIAAKPYDYVNRSKIISNATLGNQGGNEYTILRLHDAIRNYDINSYDFINRLEIDLIKNHRLKILPETAIDGVPLYVINISKVIENIKVLGKIYISKAAFEIYKMEYAVYDKRRTKTYQKKLHPNSNLPKRKEKNLGRLLYEITVEYQLHERIMYPNYISFNNSFEILQPAKFRPTAAKVNREKKCFELTFNNTPLQKDAIKQRNYRVWYRGEKLTIDSILVKNNTVLLYPEGKESVFAGKKILSDFKGNGKALSIEVKNVKDIYGNVVNEQESVLYNQFREFFVQQLKTDLIKRSSDSLYMMKNRPIFRNQPIVAPENISDYWMNTPLKN